MAGGLEKRGMAQPDGRPLGGWELQYHFSTFVGQSTPNKRACAGVSVALLQRCFSIDDALLPSGDIREQVAVRNRVKMLMFLDRHISGGGEGAAQISDRIL